MEPLRNFGTRHWWRRNAICIFTSLFMVFHCIMGSTGLWFSSKVCYVNLYHIHAKQLKTFTVLPTFYCDLNCLEIVFAFSFSFIEVFVFFPEETLCFWSRQKFGLKDKWQRKGFRFSIFVTYVVCTIKQLEYTWSRNSLHLAIIHSLLRGM